MLKVLLKNRLEALLSVLTGASRTKKAQSKGKLVGFAALMILSLVSIGTLFSRIFEVIGPAFHWAGLGWLYFALAAVITFGLMMVGNVFVAKSQLYEAKDNDLLLSMPIKPIHILLSRLFLLLVLAEVLALPVVIPAILYWPGSVDVPGWVALILSFFVILPLLNLVVSSLLGWLIHLASARARNKSLITLVISLAFLGGYMYFSFRMNSMLTSLVENHEGLEKSLGAVAPLVWIGKAVTVGELLPLLLLLAASLALGVLALLLLSRTFIRTATARGTGAKKRYVERTARAHSPRAALLIQELRRLWGLPAYLLNGGLGVFFVVLAAVALLVKGDALTGMPEWPYIAPLLQSIFVIAACFMAVTIILTAPSISLEGKSLWLPKSLPVSSWDLLQAKLRLHLLLAVPALLLCSTVMALVLGYKGLTLVLLFALPLAYALFSALLGLFENLRHPNFNWVNETQAVKSGASVMITMFVGMGMAALPVLVYALLGDYLSMEAVGFGMLGLLLVLCALLYLWLRKKGTRIFDAL